MHLAVADSRQRFNADKERPREAGRSLMLGAYVSANRTSGSSYPSMLAVQLGGGLLHQVLDQIVLG